VEVLEKPDCGVYVVVYTFEGMPHGAAMDDYERAYLSMFEQYPRSVVVFDTRRIDLPTPEVLLRKLSLLKLVKHRAVCQTLANIVLTDFPLVKQLVMRLAKAGGQTAPFYVCDSPDEVADTVSAACVRYAGRTVPGTPAGGLRFKDLDPAATTALVLVRFVSFMRHFLSLAAKQAS